MKFSDLPKLYTAHYRVTVTFDYMESWLTRIEKDYGLDLDPDFQRAHVWNDAQRTAYVEYLLQDGPSSREIQWNCPGWQGLTKAGPMVLVDGKQRLQAIRMFMSDQLPAFGLRFSQFEGRISMTNGLLFFVNDLPTRKQVLTWYLQLNAGGIAHTAEELDKVRELLKAL